MIKKLEESKEVTGKGENKINKLDMENYKILIKETISYFDNDKFMEQLGISQDQEFKNLEEMIDVKNKIGNLVRPRIEESMGYYLSDKLDEHICDYYEEVREEILDELPDKLRNVVDLEDWEPIEVFR